MPARTILVANGNGDVDVIKSDKSMRPIKEAESSKPGSASANKKDSGESRTADDRMESAWDYKTNTDRQAISSRGGRETVQTDRYGRKRTTDSNKVNSADNMRSGSDMMALQDFKSGKGPDNGIKGDTEHTDKSNLAGKNGMKINKKTSDTWNSETLKKDDSGKVGHHVSNVRLKFLFRAICSVTNTCRTNGISASCLLLSSNY